MKISILLILIPYLSLSQTVKPYAPELFGSNISGAVCGFSNNGNLIYFVKEDTIKDKLFIYQAERIDDSWQNIKILPFSGTYNDLGGRLTPDGNKFYFTSDRPGGSELENDEWNIWVSENHNGKWSNPKPLLMLNNLGLECCATPISNNKILFSSDDRKGNS